MSRAANEAEVGRPTVEQEMATFKGFSTENGETITPENPEDLNPVAGKNLSTAELAKVNEGKTGKEAAKTATAKAPAKLTDEESEAVITALDTKLGREATEDEITEALKAESSKKGGNEAKPKASVQDRIGKAVKAQRTAERRAATLEAENVQLRADLAAGKTAPLTQGKEAAKTEVKGDEPPDPKKFEYGELDTNYIRALARWEAKQEFAEQTKNQQTENLSKEQKAAKEVAQKALATFTDAGEELYDDFHEVVIEGAKDGTWPLSDVLGAALIGSEFGQRISYELASDVKEAEKVSKLPPERQLAWLGRREAAIEAESAGSGANGEGEAGKTKAAAKVDATKTETKVSRAPTPVTRTRGQGSASATPGDTSDFAAFEAAAMGRKN